VRASGLPVKWAINITDVGHLVSDGDEGEDKLAIGARREGKTAWEVAAFYEKLFFADLKKLGVPEADVVVRATETIAEQIALIQELEAKGYTYQIADGVYFDTSKLSNYGVLAKLDIEGNQAGIRVEMGDKRSGTDFALWKFSPANEQRDMEWESPWGKGFPGWHIECSAIIRKTLGDTISLHAGGVDHIPVHHTNEIAQSETVTGKPLAKHWMHLEFLSINGQKLSKSLGNSMTLEEIEALGVSPQALRLFFFSSHYRSKHNVTNDALLGAQSSLVRLRRFAEEGGESTGSAQEIYEQIMRALCNDLNVPEAIAALWELVRLPVSKERTVLLQKVDEILGLNLLEKQEVSDQIQRLVQERELARSEKRWEDADVLKTKIQEAGYAVRDTESGTILDRL